VTLHLLVNFSSVALLFVSTFIFLFGFFEYLLSLIFVMSVIVSAAFVCAE